MCWVDKLLLSPNSGGIVGYGILNPHTHFFTLQMAPQNAIEMSTKQPEGENGTKKVQNGDNKLAKNAEPPTTSVVVPPDGGWGWLVMIASFLCNTVVDGIVFSAGMFQDPIRLDFGVGKAEVGFR